MEAYNLVSNNNSLHLVKSAKNHAILDLIIVCSTKGKLPLLLKAISGRCVLGNSVLLEYNRVTKLVVFFFPSLLCSFLEGIVQDGPKKYRLKDSTMESLLNIRLALKTLLPRDE